MNTEFTEEQIEELRQLNVEYFKCRYVVPFKKKNTSSSSNDINSPEAEYQKLCAFLESSNNYESVKYEKRDFVNNGNLYDYIYKAVRSGKNSDDKNNIGSCWKIKHLNSFKDFVPNKEFQADENKKDKVSFNSFEKLLQKCECTDAWLYIFKSGVNFLTFDIKIDNEEGLKDIQDIINFQYSFKMITSERERPLNPIGNWICNELNKISNVNSVKNDAEIKCFNYELYNSNIILFNYLVLKEYEDKPIDKKIMQLLGFYLSSGFNTGFKAPENLENSSFSPFGNVLWFANSLGCGQYVTVRVKKQSGDDEISLRENFFLKRKGYNSQEQNEQKESDYKSSMPSIMFDDYFYLYILLLYQHFSILTFSERIELIFPTDPKQFEHTQNNKSENNIKLVEDFSKQISLFLIKSIYSTVSHVVHHNDYYRYVSKQLLIQENIHGLTIGLDSLQQLIRIQKNDADKEQKETHEKQMQTLSLLIVFSALTDCYAFFNDDFQGIIEQVNSLSSTYSIDKILSHISNFIGFGLLICILCVAWNSFFNGSSKIEKIKMSICKSLGWKFILLGVAVLIVIGLGVHFK